MWVLRGKKNERELFHTRIWHVWEEKESQLPSRVESTLKSIHWPEPREAEGTRVGMMTTQNTAAGNPSEAPHGHWA